MRDEIKPELEAQAAWQLTRAFRPWGDKLRACVTMRRGLAGWKRQPHERQQTLRAPRPAKPEAPSDRNPVDVGDSP